MTIFDVTNQVLLQRELSSTQSEARTDVEDLLRVFEQEPATMQEFLMVAKQKLSHLNEAMRTVGKTSAAYGALIKSTAITIHGIKGESAALGLKGVSRQADVMEDTMTKLLKRQDVSGEDLIPVVYELSRVQEQLERIERLFIRISGSNEPLKSAKPMFAPTGIFTELQGLPAAKMPVLTKVVEQPPMPVPATVSQPHPLQVSNKDEITDKLDRAAPASLAPIREVEAILSNGSNTAGLANSVTALFPVFVPPMEEMAQNLSQLTSTVARDLGKDVAFHHSIEAILPSHAMLRSLREVLPQLVRNSVAHGIEIPSERASAGKTLQGNLHLSIRKHSDDIIEVKLKDDGRGIPLKRLKRV